MAVLVAATESEAPKLLMAGLKCNSLEAKMYATAIELRKMRPVPPS